MVITIATLLAVSTSNLREFFEAKFHSKFFAAFIVSSLLATLFFAPLGYFLTNLTIKLNHLDPDALKNVELYIKDWIQYPPQYLQFVRPYISDNLKDIDINTLTASSIKIAGKIGAMSAGFVKNAFLVIIFYFFANYYGTSMVRFLKRIVQMSAADSELLIRELTSVMSVVFYSIIATAMFEGALFGIAISFMGYNGLLFGIMYGFASLIPVVGGIIMWLPFMIYEFSLGHTGNAIFIALYSIVAISIVADTFIKPLIIREINQRVLKDEVSSMNELVIFFAIIAGLASFGFWGMILGPAITAFFLAILKLFEARSQECESKEGF
jgi:predicted PurR-regulated permease PerM